MKKIFFFLLISAFLFACKRNWNEKDKSEFISGCVNKSIQEMGAMKAKAYCSCVLEKIMKKYPNANDAGYIKYDTTIRKLARECFDQH